MSSSGGGAHPSLFVVVRREGHEYWAGTVTRADVLVGRSPRSDVVLDDPQVSWTHAVVHLDRATGITFSDRSSNGSFVNGQRVTTARIGTGGLVLIPPFELELRMEGRAVDEPEYVETSFRQRSSGPLGEAVPKTGSRGPSTEPAAAARGGEGGATEWTLQFVRGPAALANTTRPLALKTTTIGRAADCDVVLEPKSVSRYHARLTPLPGGRWRVQDAGSQNGVEVNGVVVQDAEVGSGDRIGFGTEVAAVLQGPAIAPAASADPDPGTSLETLTVSASASALDETVSVVQVSGRLDSYSCSYLAEELQRLISARRHRFVVDLRRCTYCDHAGLGVLVNVHVSLRPLRGGLCLVHMSRQLSDAFTLLRLDEVLPTAPDETMALRALQQTLR